MTIRDFSPRDKNDYISMSLAMYAGDATLFSMNCDKLNATFDTVIGESPFTRGLILEQDGKAAGYALLSFTWSCEAGGMVVWLEEVYIKDDYRGCGLGSEFMEWLIAEYGNDCARFRLEVCSKNKRVIKLYEKYGFQIVDYIQMMK